MATSPRKPNWADKTIWTGDNLYIMRGMNSASVDLIYLDPPFNSKTDYAAPIGSQAAGAAFKDTWTLTDIDVEWINLIEQKHPQLYRVLLAAMTKSDKSYLVYMAARLLEMKRLLKPTGSIYLHCDPTMGHYLKAVMDAIFGCKNFKAEIIWQRSTAHNDSKTFGKVCDYILFYGTGGIYTDAVRVPLTDEQVKKLYKHKDNRGRFSSGDLTAKGLTGGGMTTISTDIPGRGDTPNIECWNSNGQAVSTFPEQAQCRAISGICMNTTGRPLPTCGLTFRPCNPGRKKRQVTLPKNRLRCCGASSSPAATKTI